jgi:endonuclease/exonuclease/phosphatase family metal-dependent hydrolase
MMYFEPVDLNQGAAAVEITQSAEISVLTYNVMGLHWPLAQGRGQALRQIGRELATLRRDGRQPDVVLIQEGFRGEVADLVRESGYLFWARGPGPKGVLGKVTGGGLHVLSDAPIVDVRSVPYASCAGWDCFARKGAMLVRLAPPGLPTPIDVVNTHMNARKSSQAPRTLTLAAHNAQTRQLSTFIQAHRAPEAPLIVGGDFNIRGSPARYYFDALERPFTVVAEYCAHPEKSCGEPATDDAEPWLKSQDLQGFHDGTVRVRPVTSETLFTGPAKLSDHNGYLVRYRLSWNTAAQTSYRPNPATEVKPQLGRWGVKVSFKR